MLESGQTIRAAIEAQSLKLADKVVLGARPEHLVLATDHENQFQGKVSLVENLGELSYVYVDTGQESEIVIKVDGDSQHAAGDNIDFAVAATDTYLFDSNGMALPRLINQ